MGTIADKLIYLNTTKSKIKDSINSLGGEITSQTTFRQYATELDSIYSSLPKVSDTGSILSLSPTLKGRLGSTLKGNTFQQTYTGKNLLKFPYTESTLTRDGITYTINNDGSITLSGTATATSYIDLYSNISVNLLEKGNTYTFSISPNNSNIRLTFLERYNNVWNDNGYGTNKITFTVSNNSEGQLIRLIVSNGSTITTPVTISPQVEQGSTAASYEPYVGGTASPNPSYPQNIQSVTGLQKVSVEGKNLFDKDSANIIQNKYLNSSGVETSDNSFSISDYMEVKSNTTYSSQPYENKSACICFYDSNKTYLSSVALLNVNPNFTTPNNCKYIRTSIWKSDINLIQINEGSTATTYEAYQSQTKELNLGTIKLNKIGDYQDYITGTIDNWSIKRQIGEVLLTGQETWAKDGTKGFYTQKDDFIRLTDYTNSILSNNFTAGGGHNSLNNYEISGYQDASYPNQNWIYIKYESMSTANEFKTWLSTHNTIVDYVLATETTEAITNQEIINQLNEIYYLQSYNGTTNITITSEDLELIMSASALKGE